MYSGPWSVIFRPRTIFDWGSFSCQGTDFDGFYDVFHTFTHVRPVHITVHQAFHPYNQWVASIKKKKTFRILLCSVVGITTPSLYIGTSSHWEKISEVSLSFSQILVCLINYWFRDFSLIWSRITGISLTVLQNMVLNSLSVRREAITVL